MVALLYLLTMLMLGACVSRRFYSFQSWVHFLATSFVVGLVLSTWLTYGLALLFASTNQPLLWANIMFLLVAALVIYELRLWRAWLPRLSRARPPGSRIWDAFFIVALVAVACYLMFGTLWLAKGNVCLASILWNDFGANLSLMQSFAVGHNFPTQYPHFIGEPIRYHFLFWFQAGNLEFLGLNLAWALDVLSVLSLVAMLILLMTLGELLFHSRVVGRIAAVLFFFPTTLSYIPFLYSQPSLLQAFKSIAHLNHWLMSGYPYRGEEWGIWSLAIYYVQRHLAVATAVLAMALIFLLGCYRDVLAKKTKACSSTDIVTPDPNVLPKTALEVTSYDGSPLKTRLESKANSAATPTETTDATRHTTESFRATLPGFILSGILLGLLPMWNSAVFIAAAAVLALLFILFPLRRQMLALAITAGLIALPQLIYLARGTVHIPLREVFHWGFTLPNPTLWNVTKYLGFTFGFKSLLIVIALIFATGLQRRVFVAISALIVITFSLKLGVETLLNHKFLNTWVTIANLFVAYGLCKIWRVRLVGKLAAVVLTASVTFGGMIEWFRIHNDTMIEVPFKPNRLSAWLEGNTRPTDVFLSERFVLHPILLNGRRIFYGWPYFGESMGYPVKARDKIYDRMFTEKNPIELVRLLNQNGIRYVAVDNGVRSSYLKAKLNEAVCRQYFETVYDDREDKFGALKIYRVPDRVQ